MNKEVIDLEGIINECGHTWTDCGPYGEDEPILVMSVEDAKKALLSVIHKTLILASKNAVVAIAFKSNNHVGQYIVDKQSILDVEKLVK